MGVSGRIAVGESDAADGRTHVVAWKLTSASSPIIYDLGEGSVTQTGQFYDPYELIDRNIVVGEAVIRGVKYPVAWNISNPARPIIYNLDPTGSKEMVAKAVSGKIVIGDYRAQDGNMHGFAYELDLGHRGPRSHHKFFDLGTLGGLTSTAYGVSGRNIVGESALYNATPHAALWKLPWHMMGHH